MNKSFLVAVIVALVSATAYARITGTNPTGASADAFCVGKSGAEVCVDYLGNVVPTTANVQTLGTASLKFTLADGSVGTSALAAGSVDSTKLANSAVQTAQIAANVVDTTKINWLVVPSAADSGKVVYFCAGKLVLRTSGAGCP